MTKKLQAIATSVICLTLAACASSLFPKNYTPGSGESLIITADIVPSYGTTGQLMRKVNINSLRFEEEPTSFMVYGGSFWKLKKVKGTKSTATFTVMSGEKSARTYKAGNYAVIGGGSSQRTGDTTINGTYVVGSGDSGGFECYNDKSPVYSVGENEIIIISMEDFGVTDQQLLDDFELVRKNYPEIIGDARIAKPSMYISFGAGTKLSESSCKESQEFELVSN